MPTAKEVAEIAAFRQCSEQSLFSDGDFDTDGSDRYPDAEKIRARWPIGAPTQSGRVTGRPNAFWAMEREIDARVEILFGPDKGNLSDAEKATLSGEMRGIAVVYSMMTGRTIEMCSVSAMERYMARHAAG